MAHLPLTSLNTFRSSGKTISTQRVILLTALTSRLTVMSRLDIKTLSFSKASEVGRIKE